MTVKVAVCQMDCRLGDVKKNLDTIERISAKVAKREPDFVCFPELATTGYSLNERWSELAEGNSGLTMERLAAVSREHGFHLICGIDERGRGKRIHDSAALLGPSGEVIGVYRKVHLWDRERDHFTPGAAFPVFRTKKAVVGVGICYDVEFPESARAMAMQGAQLLFYPSAEMLPMDSLIDTYVSSRAGENCVFTAFSNRVGREGKTVFFGHSRIVSPDTKILAKAPDSDGFAFAEVDLNDLERLRPTLPYISQRRPEVYSRYERRA